jgi:hypothetical protein
MSNVTLTDQECQMILNELATRDPVMRLLMQKQAEAQSADRQQPVPMHVVSDDAA